MARSNDQPALTCGPIPSPGGPARELFGFAGAWTPAAMEAGWGAWEGARLVGALLLERAEASAMLHGPVVVAPTAEEAREVAARLVAEALGSAGSRGIGTIFARPQGLDGVWVRAGFIPVPEPELPRPLRGAPGIGLYGWRGGSALWSAAGRGSLQPSRQPER